MRIAQFERLLAEKTQASRQKWQIDEHEKKRDQAFEELEKVSGFWSRVVFRRKIYRDAYDAYQNAENQLQERTARFRYEIEEMNRNRPALRVREELEKQRVEDVEMPARDEQLRDQAVEEKLEGLRAKLREGQDETQDQPSEKAVSAEQEPPQPQALQEVAPDFAKAAQGEQEVPEAKDVSHLEAELPANDNVSEEQARLDWEQDMLDKLQRDREEDLEQDQGLGL